MPSAPVIAIFDVGKTNKKLLLFDEQYKLVYQVSEQPPEIKDEDDFPCEDIHALVRWIKNSFDAITKDERFTIKAVNFSAYGASFVYVNKQGEVIAPLYNYLKPYPEKLKQQFYQLNGGESYFAKQTASPVLGSLNSGMQLYRIKNENPTLFGEIAFAFHLPQYLSYILTGLPTTDITSIGCHTNLWNFNEHRYHRWVSDEEIERCFAPVAPCSLGVPFFYNKKEWLSGIGLHDSSAALIPYFISFNEPFILLSTGTWCITLNPFNHTQLSDYDLHQDCLCYLSYQGNPVKASRLFAGYEHEQQTKRIAAHFNKPADHYKTTQYDLDVLKKLKPTKVVPAKEEKKVMVQQSVFGTRSLENFASYEEAYHQLIADIIVQQVSSTNLVLKGTTVKRIFVDGGFGSNPIYMHLLAKAFPYIEVYAASVPQASALGAALAIHAHWNSKPFPADIIEIKLYSITQNASI